MRSKKFKRGFTLIEIGIVLMVIGIIIGAIMKGKDIIKSAQAKDFAQTFANKWVMVADVYFDKVGQNLGDGTKNGGTAVGATPATLPDGYMEAVNLYDSATGGATTNNTDIQTALKQALSNAGINVVGLIKSNLYNGAGTLFIDNYNPFEISVAGEFTDTVRVGVALRSYYIASETTTGLPMLRNVVVFRNVPGDLAQAFDKIVDGVADGTRGRVLAFGVSQTSMDTVIPGNDAIVNIRTSTSQTTIDYTGIDTGALFNIGVVLDH